MRYDHYFYILVKSIYPFLKLAQGDPTSPSYRRSVLSVHWKDWCCSWNSNNLATWCEDLTHLKRLWCWERLRAGGEGDNRGWDGWMASLTRWTWVSVNSGSWWWTGRPGVLQFMGSHRVGHDYWATELNWTELKISSHIQKYMIIRRRNIFPLLQISPPNWKFLTKDLEEKEKMGSHSCSFPAMSLSIWIFFRHLILIDSIKEEDFMEDYLLRNSKVSIQKMLTIHHFWKKICDRSMFLLFGLILD